MRHGRGRYSSSYTNWRDVRCSDSSDETAAANGHFNCLEAHIRRTTPKICCITHSLNLVMSNQHDMTLIRNSLATRGDMHKVFKAANHVVHVQERDCFQCKACTSASCAGWRLIVLKPLCFSFLSLLRISQSEKMEYHSSRLKAHFKWTCCDGRIFHHVHADHKIGDWLQCSTVQVLAANLEENSLTEDTADGIKALKPLVLNCMVFSPTFPNTLNSLDFPSAPCDFHWETHNAVIRP